MSLAVVDVETTGLSVQEDRVVELGVLRFSHEKEEMDRFLLDPGIPIPEDVSQIHGFTDEHVRGQPSIRDRWADIQELLHEKLVVGYNCLKFDLPLIANDVARAQNADPPHFPLVLDVFVFVMWHLRGLRSRKLVDVCAHFGIKPQGGTAHRALVDCRLTLELLCAMQEKGLIPDELEKTLVLQNQYQEKINNEFSQWSYWLYEDRTTGALCMGAGKYCGQSLTQIPTSELYYFVAKEKLKAPAQMAVYGELERRGEQVSATMQPDVNDNE